MESPRRRAAGAAGLKVIDIINEPTIAALAFAFRRVVEAGAGLDAAEKIRAVGEAAGGDSTVLVCDLGGGTFDVTKETGSGTFVGVTTPRRAPGPCTATSTTGNT